MSPVVVEVASWAGEYGPGTLAASIYALHPADRVAGAVAAHQAGCLVHVDMILSPDRGGGLRNDGVTVEQLRAVSEAAPRAPVDLHVMVLGEPSDQARREGLDRLAGELVGQRVDRLCAVPAVLDHLVLALGPRRPRVQRWCELWPGLEVPDGPALDGVLLMLIEPGTKQVADVGRLAAIPDLAVHIHVGTDGGASRQIADQALGAGASYVVLGRALFTDLHHRPSARARHHTDRKMP